MNERTIVEMRTRNLLGTFWVSVFLLAAPVVAQAATDLEIIQLPKFCWEQMGSKVAKGPEFRIPKGCGPGMNHYCPGLVELVRARQEFNDRERLILLGKAKTAAKYTLDWMRKYPKCPIRGHVEATLAEIERLKLSAGSPK